APHEPLTGEVPAVESEPAPPRRRLEIRWGRVFLVLLGLFVAYLAWELITWPDVAALANKHPRTTAFIERYQRGAWWGLGPDREVEWKWVSYGRISSNLKRRCWSARTSASSRTKGSTRWRCGRRSKTPGR